MAIMRLKPVAPVLFLETNEDVEVGDAGESGGQFQRTREFDGWDLTRIRRGGVKLPGWERGV